MLGLTGSVHDAAHYCNSHLLDAGMLESPDRHPLAEIILDLLSHLLKECARGAAAAGAGRYLRGEAAEPERLKNLLCDSHFLRPVSTGCRGERDPDGVADAVLKK